MSDNDELKRQIALLQSAINSKQPLSGRATRYSSSFRPPSQRFSPMRPVIRPSRNMKLIVKDESRVNGNQQQQQQQSLTEPKDTVKYVSKGNKLVRVGSGLLSTTTGFQATSVGRPRPGFVFAKPGNSNMTLRTAANDRSNSSRVVNIDGEAYVRRGHGNKLVRASAVPATKPKAGAGSAGNKRIVSIDGDDFVRSKKGSLIRVSALRLYNSHMRGSSKSYQSSAFRAPKRRSKRLCTRFLYDKCEKTAEECGFSHELSPETVPLCLHYQRDMCTKPGCRFVHRKINPEAPICREFVYKGFCPKGNSCKHRHIWQCPDWVEKGKCLRKKCKLPHPDPSKNTAASIQSSAEAIGQRQMSKEDEQNFVKNFIQRPRFDKNSGSDEIDDLLAFENESYQSEKEGDDDDDDDDEEEGGGDLEDDLSGDEAEELLKWYDDNHSTDQDSKQVAA